MKPFPYQIECLQDIDRFGGRWLGALDMGLGKTPVSLWWLKQNKQALPAVVVCPAAVKYVWESEAMKAVDWRAMVLEGQTPHRITGKPKLVIINYDILRFWLAQLRELKPQMIVLDECQRIANRTKQTTATKALCQGVPHVLALSGTPLVNRPIELHNAIQILCPREFRSRWVFAQKFCGPKWTPWGWKYPGATKVHELNKLLTDTCMTRKRKADVLPDLPEKIRQVVPLPIWRPGEYQQASDDFLTWLRRKSPNKAAKAANAQELVKVGYLLRLAARLKLHGVVDWINEFLDGCSEKLVVFALHRKMIEALERRCKARSVTVDGRTTGRKRAAAVDRFQTDNKTRLLFGNVKAAGVGIDLTAASAVALVELPWTPGACLQAEDRCHRIGQSGTVWCHYLVAKNTIEEKLCSIIQEKQNILSAVLDGGAVAGDLNVYNQLLRELKGSKL